MVLCSNLNLTKCWRSRRRRLGFNDLHPVQRHKGGGTGHNGHRSAVLVTVRRFQAGTRLFLLKLLKAHGVRSRRSKASAIKANESRGLVGLSNLQLKNLPRLSKSGSLYSGLAISPLLNPEERGSGTPSKELPRLVEDRRRLVRLFLLSAFWALLWLLEEDLRNRCRVLPGLCPSLTASASSRTCRCP